ncbi:VOC family protein [Pseudomonas aeruginosa]
MSPTLTHLALHVPDLDACIAFYENLLRHAGDPPAPRQELADRLDGRTRPGTTLHLRHHARRPAAATLASDDYSHFGFALSSRAAADDLARRAEAAGCLVWAPRDEPYPVGYYCGLRDPAGNYAEFSYGQPLGPGSEALPIP